MLLFRLRVEGLGFRAERCGLWVVGCGLWVVGCGLWVASMLHSGKLPFSN